ncbi:M15 family metallopeptidase [Winogradskyella tangerina]|uniref:M15 family metallopeptidase n=1 Tax=Winogradskyella tangerina TaxID=2023240 RepID=UPI000DBE70CA|nr:M15 family metallopeptidase [Winogradskyella tangerina]
MKQLVHFLFFASILFSCKSETEQIPLGQMTPQIKDTIVSKPKDTLNLNKDKVLGRINYRNDSTFSKVRREYSNKTIYLQKEVYGAFLNMVEAAEKDNVNLKIISGTRNFYEQKAIWERKWEKYKDLDSITRTLNILEYSSMPGSSRHHWGTEIDLNSLNNLYFNSGKGLKEYNWLQSHANTFGFYQVYTDKSRGRSGYQLEKWHWSYLPLASKYLAYYNANISYKDLTGFNGSEMASQLQIIEDYVNGISKKAINYN